MTGVSVPIQGLTKQIDPVVMIIDMAETWTTLPLDKA